MARVLSKLGYCSRSQACSLILAGRVQLNGATCRNPEAAVNSERDRLHVDGALIGLVRKVYLMVNKPRGLVTTRVDEHGRDTIYRCLESQNLAWVSPVGRLDKASEGLILFTNDTIWADCILAPARHLDKVYAVQVDCRADEALCQRLVQGLSAAGGDFLSARHAQILRHGTRNSWLQVVLDEGKNRHIRRLLEACDIQVLRLIRIAIGPLALGDLPKGQFRYLTDAEIAALSADPQSDCS